MKTVEAEQLSLKYLEPEEISIAASLLFQAYKNGLSMMKKRLTKKWMQKIT